MQARALILVMVIAFPAWAGGDSSDGHTHAAPEPVPMKAGVPRAAAVSEEFEAVVVLEGKKLRLYLDRHASNEPVAGARVEIEGDALTGVAAESSPGVYVIDARSFPAGSHALTIAVETADSADLLLATLDIAPAPVVDAHVHGWNEWPVWPGAGGLALAGGALWVLWVLRRRKQARGVK